MNLIAQFVSYVQSLKQYELQYDCKLELKHKAFLHIMNLKSTVLKKQGVYKLLADSNRCIESVCTGGVHTSSINIWIFDWFDFD